MFRKLLDQGEAGDHVGLLLRGVDKNEIKRGMVPVSYTHLQKSINCTFPLWRAMRAVNSSFSGTCGASQIVNFVGIVCCRGCIWRFMS